MSWRSDRRTSSKSAQIDLKISVSAVLVSCRVLNVVSIFNMGGIEGEGHNENVGRMG